MKSDKYTKDLEELLNEIEDIEDIDTRKQKLNKDDDLNNEFSDDDSVEDTERLLYSAMKFDKERRKAEFHKDEFWNENEDVDEKDEVKKQEWNQELIDEIPETSNTDTEEDDDSETFKEGVGDNEFEEGIEDDELKDKESIRLKKEDGYNEQTGKIGEIFRPDGHYNKPAIAFVGISILAIILVIASIYTSPVKENTQLNKENTEKATSSKQVPVSIPNDLANPQPIISSGENTKIFAENTKISDAYLNSYSEAGLKDEPIDKPVLLPTQKENQNFPETNSLPQKSNKPIISKKTETKSQKYKEIENGNFLISLDGNNNLLLEQNTLDKKGTEDRSENSAVSFLKIPVNTIIKVILLDNYNSNVTKSVQLKTLNDVIDKGIVILPAGSILEISLEPVSQNRAITNNPIIIASKDNLRFFYATIKDEDSTVGIKADYVSYNQKKKSFFGRIITGVGRATLGQIGNSGLETIADETYNTYREDPVRGGYLKIPKGKIFFLHITASDILKAQELLKNASDD